MKREKLSAKAFEEWVKTASTRKTWSVYRETLEKIAEGKDRERLVCDTDDEARKVVQAFRVMRNKHNLQVLIYQSGKEIVLGPGKYVAKQRPGSIPRVDERRR